MFLPLLVQFFFLCFFISLQNARPAVTNEVDQKWFGLLLVSAQVWGVSIGYVLAVQVSTGGVAADMSLGAVLIFYISYSFCNYWWHRIRHENKYLWAVLHAAHHSPRRMHTLLAWFRNPLEITLDLLVVFFVAFILKSPVEAVVWGMCLEGVLELFHHSNIKTHRRARWVGYFVQLPEMHRVHHQTGVHSGNYSTVIWDFVFGTLKFNWPPVSVGLNGGLLDHYVYSPARRERLTALEPVAHYKAHITTKGDEDVSSASASGTKD